MADRLPRLGILVGVDGSACAKTAARWAAGEAAMRDVPLTVVHVLHPPDGGWARGLSTAPLPEDFDQMQQQYARQVIDDAVGIIKDATAHCGRPVQISSKVLVSPVVPTLIDLASDAQMIVVGSRGHNAVQRTALIHHAHCPVAVIRQEGVPLKPSSRPVLVGIDGSPASESATAIAFEEASLRGVDLVALHACSDADVSDLPDRQWSAARSAVEETLAERLAGWRERYPDVSVQRVVMADHPARHLIDHSESAQLVVVGLRGRGEFAGMLGSVSTAVVHAVRTPVIVARQP